jgi:hypothetical protein
MNKLILSFALIFGTSVLVNAQIEKGPKIEFSKEVHDYGKLKSTKKPGLGTTLFEVFAPDWKLKSNENGTLATMSTAF